MELSHILTPLSDADAEVIRKKVIDYWNAIAHSDDLRGIPEGLVHESQARVTELLQSNQVWDVYEAQRVTARFEYRRQACS